MTEPAAIPTEMRVIALDEVDSTNAEVLRRWEAGERGPLWVTACVQNKGRGRHGRSWVSGPGNLYASRLIEVHDPARQLTELAFAAALAAFDTASALLPGTARNSLTLKWPNDLLIDGAKTCGILLEAAGARTGPRPVAIGIGLNLASHPDGTAAPATHLAAHGASADPGIAFGHLMPALDRWLATWHGEGLAPLREAWLTRAHPPGTRLSIRAGAEVLAGCFAGLGDDGALLLETDAGKIVRLVAGDLFLDPAGTKAAT